LRAATGLTQTYPNFIEISCYEVKKDLTLFCGYSNPLFLFSNIPCIFVKNTNVKQFHRFRNKLNKWFLNVQGATLSPTAQVHHSVEISIPKRIILKDNSILYKMCTIYVGNDGCFELGLHSHVAPYGYFLVENQKLIIGNDVAIGPFCSFFCVSNSTQGDLLFRKNYNKADIHIGNNVFIGSHCVILPGTIIRDNIVVAANSVVMGELRSGCLYAGNPAVVVKELR